MCKGEGVRDGGRRPGGAWQPGGPSRPTCPGKLPTYIANARQLTETTESSRPAQATHQFHPALQARESPFKVATGNAITGTSVRISGMHTNLAPCSRPNATARLRLPSFDTAPFGCPPQFGGPFCVCRRFRRAAKASTPQSLQDSRVFSCLFSRTRSLECLWGTTFVSFWHSVWGCHIRTAGETGANSANPYTKPLHQGTVPPALVCQWFYTETSRYRAHRSPRQNRATPRRDAGENDWSDAPMPTR